MKLLLLVREDQSRAQAAVTCAFVWPSRRAHRTRRLELNRRLNGMKPELVPEETESSLVKLPRYTVRTWAAPPSMVTSMLQVPDCHWLATVSKKTLMALR